MIQGTGEMTNKVRNWLIHRSRNNCSSHGGYEIGPPSQGCYKEQFQAYQYLEDSIRLGGVSFVLDRRDTNFKKVFPGDENLEKLKGCPKQAMAVGLTGHICYHLSVGRN